MAKTAGYVLSSDEQAVMGLIDPHVLRMLLNLEIDRWEYRLMLPYYCHAGGNSKVQALPLEDWRHLIGYWEG
jgi:hypothetical protein